MSQLFFFFFFFFFLGDLFIKSLRTDPSFHYYQYMCYGHLRCIAQYFVFRLYDSALATIILKAT